VADDKRVTPPATTLLRYRARGLIIAARRPPWGVGEAQPKRRDFMNNTITLIAVILGMTLFSGLGCSRAKHPTGTTIPQGPAASDATVYIGPKRPSDSAESNPGEALIREAVLRVIREDYLEQLFDDLNITSEVEKQLLKMKGSETTKID